MPEELAEAKYIAHGLFAITDSIVEHYEAKAIKMYPKLLEHIDSQAREIERLRIELSDLVQLHGQKSIDMMQQAAVIRELNMENARIESGWSSDIDHYEKERKKTHAALKKLGSMVRARGKALVEERANQIGWLTFDRGEMSWEEATREDARKQLEAEGKI